MFEVSCYGNQQIGDALNRFIRYAVSPASEITSSGSVLYWFDNINIDDQLLKLCHQEIEYIVIPLAYKNYPGYGVINLFRYDELKERIVQAIQHPNPHNLLYIENVKARMNVFFQGHGQESLYSVLNWTKYYCDNGIKGLTKSPLERKQFIDIYLKPGQQYWSEFIIRFSKYKSLISICGFREEINAIDVHIQKFQGMVDKLNAIIFGIIPDVIIYGLLEGIPELDEIHSIFEKIENQVKTL